MADDVHKSQARISRSPSEEAKPTVHYSVDDPVSGTQPLGFDIAINVCLCDKSVAGVRMGLPSKILQPEYE